MTVFDKNFIFLVHPGGEVEDLAGMKAAGFSGVFCNVGDYDPSEWSTIRNQAKNAQMFCGPWLRTQEVNDGPFSLAKLVHLISVAADWKEPFIVNSEKELDGSGNRLTTTIAQLCEGKDAAISMEAWLFSSVDWTPVANMPMLLQISPGFSITSKDPLGCRQHAWDSGIKCVYFTFGTFGGQKPSDYDLKSPYSIYDGNGPGPNFKPWSPTSVGYKACKEEIVVLPQLTEMQVPYTGPYYGPGAKTSGHPVSEGKTAEALKRALSRMGYMPWVDFNQHYGPVLEAAMKKWQAKVGIAATGQYGKGSWEMMRWAVVPGNPPQYALDPPARKLIQDEAASTSESKEMSLVQKFITEFWTLAIANNKEWHYVQDRPFTVHVDPSGKNLKSDCSGTVVQAHAYAALKSKIGVPDPAQQSYSGYGNTDEHEDDWPHIIAPFRIGDLAHFASPRHVIECIKPGGITTAQWGSNGSEDAPELITSLSAYHRYPQEFLYVVRPELLPPAV